MDNVFPGLQTTSSSYSHQQHAVGTSLVLGQRQSTYWTGTGLHAAYDKCAIKVGPAPHGHTRVARWAGFTVIECCRVCACVDIHMMVGEFDNGSVQPKRCCFSD
jgi:hypothetical protein